jgi:hypothetical protein
VDSLLLYIMACRCMLQDTCFERAATGTSVADRRPTSSWLSHPIPNSSTRSSGVPQRLQMIAEQSPQTNGSATAIWQRGQ